QSHGGHALGGKLRREVLVEAGPTAVTRQYQREGIAIARRVDFVDRQIVDVRRPRGDPRFQRRNELGVGLQELRQPVALHRKAVTYGRQADDLGIGAALGERVDVLGAADLVLLALERDPGLLERLGRLENDFALAAGGVMQ